MFTSQKLIFQLKLKIVRLYCSSWGDYNALYARHLSIKNELSWIEPPPPNFSEYVVKGVQ